MASATLLAATPTAIRTATASATLLTATPTAIRTATASAMLPVYSYIMEAATDREKVIVLDTDITINGWSYYAERRRG